MYTLAVILTDILYRQAVTSLGRVCMWNKKLHLCSVASWQGGQLSCPENFLSENFLLVR